MKNKEKIVKISIVILMFLIVILGINKYVKIDRYNGLVDVKNITSKVNASVLGTSNEVKGNETLKYDVEYMLEESTGEAENRKVIIEAKINDTTYASFKLVEGENIESKIEEDGTRFDFTTPIMETITLYAVYNINSYTLTINPNGGIYNDSSEIQTETLEYGSVKEISIPTREGYTFEGWNVSKENILIDNKVTMPASDVTLEAVWSINSYTLTINPNGGIYNDSSEIQTEKVEYGSV